MLDVNAGIPLADEPALLARAIELVQSVTDVPLSIDSSIVAALEAGLAVYKGKPLVNSVTGEEDRLETVLPLVKKYGAAVVAISNDETGISQDPDVRFAVAKKIVERAADYGIPASDIVVDPLVMPIGAINQAGVQVMALVHRLRTELKVNTTCGASNVSFGLPERNGINAAFLTMAIGAGHDLGHHQSAACGSDQGHHGRRRDDGPRPGLHALDPQVPRSPAVGADGEMGRGRREVGARVGRTRAPRPWRRTAMTPAPVRGRIKDAAGDVLSTKDPLVVFTPSGRGPVSGRHPVLQAARSLGVDIDSVCGGRGICGRCQVTQAEGEFAKHGVKSRAEHLSRLQARSRRNTARPSPWPPGGACRVRPRCSATWSSTCPRAARCTARWCARRPRRTTSSSTRWSGCISSRCSSPTCTTRRAICAGWRTRSSSNGG
jgi:5-methyltetrahydrofolate--homocysteine methyltransferase